MNNTFKLVDGYALNVGDGYSYVTNWVDVREKDFISFTTVFTGGSPVGTLSLQQSNDLQFTGGNRVEPLQAAGAVNSFLGATQIISDTCNVPAGTGQSTVNVNGAGAYALNQFLVPYAWVRVVYTASSNANTQLDIFCQVKAL